MLGLVLLAGVLPWPGRLWAQTSEIVQGRPGEVLPDFFHPDHQPSPQGTRPPLPNPRRGGDVNLHLFSMPRHLNGMTENSASTRYVLHALHESLLFRDWETWEYRGGLAEQWHVEDLVVLADAEATDRIHGQVEQRGEQIVVRPVSPGNPLGKELVLDREDVDHVAPQTVFTFALHPDVQWHDGHAFDARDVLFSWRCYQNPDVDCDAMRPTIAKIVDAQLVDRLTLRFFYDEPYFLAPQSFERLTILPSHLYDLSDPDHADYSETRPVTEAQQGEYVRNHPANTDWIGLGPYRLTAIDNEGITAERFEDYFDGERSGWLERIRWVHIPDDTAARTALLNGELDHYERLSSNDFFGGFCQSDAFKSRLYAGYAWMPRINYLAWNMRRPLFEDARVRRALAHCFDWDELLDTQAGGLGVRVTGTNFYLGPAYDHSIEPIPADLDRARALLDESGWYDRDGDGLRSKDGVDFSFEFLATTGNRAILNQAQVLQENLSQVGVQVSIVQRDWATYIERCRAKDFDVCSLSWAMDVENDPSPYWQSYDGPPGQDRSKNYPGLSDPEIDARLESIQSELDSDRRNELLRDLQARIYDLQPYLFGYMVPIKFCVAKHVRNYRSYSINPGYSVRDWYVVE